MHLDINTHLVVGIRFCRWQGAIKNVSLSQVIYSVDKNIWVDTQQFETSSQGYLFLTAFNMLDVGTAHNIRLYSVLHKWSTCCVSKSYLS